MHRVPRLGTGNERSAHFSSSFYIMMFTGASIHLHGVWNQQPPSSGGSQSGGKVNQEAIAHKVRTAKRKVEIRCL